MEPSVPDRRSPATFSLALVLFGFLGIALVVYQPAFSGTFLSDDEHYVVGNPYVTQPSTVHLLNIASPTGEPARMTHNYAPIPLYLFTLEWQLFGRRMTGYHVVNVVLHTFASCLLVVFFHRSGVPFTWAAGGGAFFLLHPANVEAVAWISQAKTTCAMVFMLLALVLYRQRPVAGTVAFGLALLTKITAAVALPVALLSEWILSNRPVPRRRRLRRPETPPHWKWFAVWALLVIAVAIAQLLAFEVGRVDAMHPNAIVRVRTIISFALRYLVMALTSYGVSAFHSPEPSLSPLDPWFLAGLGVVALVGWRLFETLRTRKIEGVYWLWAVASFFPISQIFPFAYPMADRYLYFILPGLIGAASLGAHDRLSVAERNAEPKKRAQSEARSRGIAFAVGALLLVVLAAFGARSRARAQIWQDDKTVQADSALHYPDGIAASLLEAKRAAREGRPEEAISSLQKAYDRGYKRFPDLYSDPDLKVLMSNEHFRQLIRKMARHWIDVLGRYEHLPQLRLKLLAHAYFVVGDNAAAIRTFERALTVPGPITDEIQEQLAQLRALIKVQPSASPP